MRAAFASWSRSLHPPVFGDGVEGAAAFDGAATVLGIAPSAGIYTLTRDIVLATMQVDAGVQIDTNGFRIFVAGTLTHNGTIQRNGNDAAGTVAGAAHAVNLLAGGTAGGTSFSSKGIPGVHDGSMAALKGAQPSNPGAAGDGIGRGGGGGAGPGNSGGEPGVCSLTQLSAGGADFVSLVRGRNVQGTQWNSATGGGVGGAVGAGAGGGGGGYVVVCARTITGTGTIEAHGGNGAQGAANTGGGGGGGGGLIVLAYESLAGVTTDVAGGAPGAANGTGAAGGAGHAGWVFEFNLGAA